MRYSLLLSQKKLIAFFLVIYLISRIAFIPVLGDDYNIYVISAVALVVIGASLRFAIDINLILFIVLILWMISVVLWNYLFTERIIDNKGQSNFAVLIGALLNISIFFVVGFVVAKSGAVGSVIKLRFFLFALLLLFVSIFSFFSTGAEVDYGKISSRMHDGYASHLTFGSSMVLFSFIAYVASKPVHRWLVVLGATAGLFLLSGRAALLFFVFSIFLNSLATRFSKLLLAIFGVVGLVLVGILVFFIEIADASVIERLSIFTFAIEGMPRQIWFGGVEQILQYSSNYGGYVHNLLSMVQFFGAFPLLVLFALMVSLTRAVFSFEVQAPAIILGRLLACYGILSLLFSKVFFEWIVWFGFGYGCGLAQYLRNASARSLLDNISSRQ